MGDLQEHWDLEREEHLARLGVTLPTSYIPKVECMHCHRMFDPATSMLADLPICDWCFDHN